MLTELFDPTKKERPRDERQLGGQTGAPSRKLQKDEVHQHQGQAQGHPKPRPFPACDAEFASVVRQKPLSFDCHSGLDKPAPHLIRGNPVFLGWIPAPRLKPVGKNFVGMTAPE